MRMQHIAIMRKSWGFTDKILSGDKTIESRWYKTKRAPWGKIQPNDTVYFKNSGEPIKLRAGVDSVLQFENLTPVRIKEILARYGLQIGIGPAEIPKFYELFKNKRYCILVFLKNATSIKPFEINKSGYGNMSAWIAVSSIDKLH